MKDSDIDKYSINSIRFEQFFKSDPPKFDISFGRGKFSKLSQLNSSNVTQSKDKTTIKSSANNNNIQNQQKKSSITSTSAKLSSKIKKKYSRPKIADGNKTKNLNNRNIGQKKERKITAAEKQQRMTEAKKLMNKKSK